jgi:GAF domain-containing protein
MTPNPIQTIDRLQGFIDAFMESPPAPLRQNVEGSARLVAEMLPGKPALRYLRHTQGVLEQWAAHPPQPATGDTAPDALQAAAIASRVYQVDGLRAVIPLLADQRAHSLLDCVYSDPADMNPEVLSRIGPQISMILRNSVLDEQVEALARIAAELTTATSYRDAAAIIGRNLLERGQFIAIQLIRRDDKGQPTHMVVVASANRNAAYEVEGEAVPLTGIDYDTIFRPLIELGEPLAIEGVQNDPRLTGPLREWLDPRIKSVYLTPLRIAGETIGFLSINETRERMFLSPRLLRLYRSAADQTAAILQNQNLLAALQQNLALAEETSAVSQQMVRAGDIEGLLHALYTTYGDADSIGHFIQFVNDDEDMLVRVVPQCRVDASGMAQGQPIAVSPELRQTLGWYLAQSDADAHFEEGRADAAPPNPLWEMLGETTGGSGFSLPVLRDGERIGQISLSWPGRPRLAQPTRAALTALASQIATLVNNRLLLDTTRQASQVLAEQLGRTSAINALAANLLRTNDEQTILDMTARTLVDMTGVDHVGIVTLDADGSFFTIVSEYPQSPGLGAKLETGGEVMDLLRQRQAAVIINDIATNPAITPMTREALMVIGTRSALIVPMIDTTGQLTGSVGLDTFAEDRTFTQDEATLAGIVVSQMTAALQKLRALQRAEAQVALTNEVNRVASDLLRLEDEQEILDSTARALVALTGVDHVGIVTLDPDGKFFTLVSEEPVSPVLGIKIEAGGEVVDLLRERRQPVIINNIATNPILTPSARESLTAVGTVSALFVPLLDQHGDLIGNVGLDILTEGRFLDEDAATVAQLVVSQMATALEKTRARQQTQQQADNLELVASLSQRLQRATSRSAVYVETLAALRDILQAEESSVMFVDQRADALFAAATLDINRGVVLFDTPVLVDEPWRVALQAHRGGAPVREPDLHLADPAAAASPMRDAIAYPVLRRGQLEGVLEIQASQPFRFSQIDVVTLGQIASQFGAALEGIANLEQNQRLVESRLTIDQINAELQQQPDIESMMRLTATELARALGARKARIRLGVAPQSPEDPAPDGV